MKKVLNGEVDTSPLIVLIEDDPDHAELMQRSMAKSGVTSNLIHLSDGKEAIDYFGSDQPPPLPKLILLDLNLPKVNGWKVLERLKNSAYAIVPVVILSSSSDPEDITRSTEMHANSYVSKPTRFKGYVELAHDLSAYWLGWNKLAPTPH